MKLKKLMAIVMTGILAAGVLAGCGGGSSAGTDSGSTAAGNTQQAAATAEAGGDYKIDVILKKT